MNTKTIKAADLETGLRLVTNFYGDTMRISGVRATSAGSTMVVELADGTTRYYRPQAALKVRV